MKHEVEWGVHCHHDRRVLVGESGEVATEPFHLLGSNHTVVVAFTDFSVASAGVDILDVVENHIMYFSEIERVISGANEIAEGFGGTEVGSDIRVVVVITHYVIYGAVEL